MKKRSFPAILGMIALPFLVAALLAACSNSKPASAPVAAKAKSAAGSAASTDPPATTALKPYTGSDTIIGSADAQSRSVTLNIIGGQGDAGSGFNFNGYANGDMVIKIPVGWKVTVNFTVESSLSHSLVVAPWAQRQAGSFTPAFGGAATPNYSTGIHKGDPAVQFSFPATSAGQYAIVCAVPGHDDLGMWDELDVVGGLAKPEVLVK
ncbi:MAG TPA: sulfocyanin-like copper-binding protein [Spirochaetia bacterium]|nr:sulfocyanin-like copper-binding protein [Spirochaetia bacterium]